jgi:hypothetical protein
VASASFLSAAQRHLLKPNNQLLLAAMRLSRLLH